MGPEGARTSLLVLLHLVAGTFRLCSMGVLGEKFVDRLVPVLAAGDPVAACELLDGLAGDELAEATSWFATSKRWIRNVDQHVTLDPKPRAADDDHLVRWHDQKWILAMCAVRLCGPRRAASRIAWGDFWDYRTDEGEAMFVHLLWDRDPPWVAEFADAASRVRLGGRERNSNGTLSRVLRAASMHHGLPAPTGDTFLKRWRDGAPSGKSWVEGGSQRSFAESLAADPFMPEVLWLYLASGHCGDYEAWLPGAMASLTESGVVDRDTLVETVLVALTAGQPPAAQRTLVKILEAIGLCPEEVRGGIAYLVGVLATGDRSVPPVLLPLALALVGDGEEMRGLVDVVSGRPEKKPRAQLLSALRNAELRARVGDEAMTKVLDVLADTDDAAYAAKADALRTRLGLGARHAPAGRALGLWELAPGSSGTERADTRWSIDDYWRWVLDPWNPDNRRSSVAEVVDCELSVMGQGSYDPARMTRAVKAALSKGGCHAGALGLVLEELFLSGGMRGSWNAALECVGLCADPRNSMVKRPTGLAELLRVLSRYAVEAPGTYAVPRGLGALAAESSSSKAAVEARRLVGFLTGEDEQIAVARLRSATATPTEVHHRGLWDLMPEEVTPLPEQVPVMLGPSSVDELRRLVPPHWSRVTAMGDLWAPAPDPTQRLLVGIVDSEVLLATVLAALHLHGADAAHPAFLAADRGQRRADEVLVAIECWLDDALDISVFWRVATSEVASEVQVRHRWRVGALVRDAQAWRKQLAPFAQRLHEPDDHEAGVLVVPSEIGTPGQRFLFLRAVEALLRAADSPVLLGLPSWRDGTIDFDELLARLREVASAGDQVGPLDLVVALHRLREVDPARADEVPDGLLTDPRFTAISGTESWDATALVRRWIAAGGLPALQPLARDGAWTGAPPSPVPYPTLEAWPAELAEDPWSPTVVADDDWSKFCAEAVLRLYPRWSDRAMPYAHLTGWWGRVPALAIGPLGLALHDVLLSQLTPAGAANGRPHPAEFLQQVRWGRIDPATAAAAAVGRHEAGTLGLTGMVRTLGAQMETHLRGLWPIALAIADALCGVSRRPAAHADLLRLLTTYAHEVPADVRAQPPAGIAALATGKGSTKAHLAARDLVKSLQDAT